MLSSPSSNDATNFCQIWHADGNDYVTGTFLPGLLACGKSMQSAARVPPAPTKGSPRRLLRSRCQLFAQRLVLGLDLLEAAKQRRDLLLAESRRDVLGAIPIERHEMEDK